MPLIKKALEDKGFYTGPVEYDPKYFTYKSDKLPPGCFFTKRGAEETGVGYVRYNVNLDSPSTIWGKQLVVCGGTFRNYLYFCAIP